VWTRRLERFRAVCKSATTVESVIYIEARPPSAFDDLVRCFWELRTEEDLADDFTLHARPTPA
jgi:hypothetical protein